MAMSMASRMGKFVEYDESDPLGWKKYMRFRVDLRLDKPLLRGTRVAVKNGSKLVTFQYEKLMDICYACGCFRHCYQQCPKYDDAIPESDLPYGGLKTTPTKRRRGTDHRREEEVKDMGYNGNIFTWGNNQSTPSAMYERLDRAVTSLEWITLIPHAAVIHIPRDRSDHVPLKLIDSPLGGGGKKKFRIEDMWITTPGCERVVKDVWSRGEGLQNAADLIVKIKKCGTALQKWNREEFGHIQTKIKEARKRLAYLDSCAPSDSIVVERKKVSSSIDNLLYLEETMWRKQSRVINLCEGDQNTKFFYMKTSCRKKRNFVKGVHNDNWEWVTDQESVNGVAQRYFQNNFSSSNPEYVEEIIVGIQGRVIG
ncbi:hypothetical protein SOVF_086500, partial [Spinacia oleracea]